MANGTAMDELTDDDLLWTRTTDPHATVPGKLKRERGPQLPRATFRNLYPIIVIAITKPARRPVKGAHNAPRAHARGSLGGPHQSAGYLRGRRPSLPTVL